MSSTDWEGNPAQHCFSENQRDRGSISTHAATIIEALSQNVADYVLFELQFMCDTYHFQSRISGQRKSCVHT